MKHIKLFEEYSEEAYNRILDLYREKGEDHMTPEEVAYLKSGGETDIPPPRKDLQLMKDPFVLSIGEDFTTRHFDPQRPSDKPYTEEETLALQKMEKDRTVSFRTFVFHNYEPIKINDQNKRWINQIWMGSDLYTGEDLTPPGAEELSSATGNPQAPDYENRFHKIINNYFGQYDEGLVYWYFDDDYPNWRDQWNSYIERGGWLNTSGEWAADIGAAVTGSRTPPKPWNIDLETLEIDLQGKKLTMDNIKKEIKLREVLNQLGDWQEGWERLLDRENGYLPTMSWSLFDHLPK